MRLPLPITVIAELLGVEPERRDFFRDVAQKIAVSMGPAALEGKDPKLAAVYQPAAAIDQYGAQYIAVIATGEHENGKNS
ncbi:MAG: cytochrome P450, partial [Chloroflexota bacterium]|nr:cytochrome P450 [Chloroflexota bacterium]